MRKIKRGLLLPLWRGLFVCLSVNLFVLATTVKSAKAVNPIKVPFEMWNVVGEGTMY